MISPRFLLFSIFLLSTIIDITSGLKCSEKLDLDVPGLKKADASFDFGAVGNKDDKNCVSCGRTKAPSGLTLECFTDKCGEGLAKSYPKAGEDCTEKTGGIIKCCCDDKDNCNGGMGMFPRIGVLALSLTLGGILTLHASLQ